MALNIYLSREDCSLQIVREADSFFNANTVIEDNEVTRMILKDIDNAKYNNSNTFLSGFMMTML